MSDQDLKIQTTRARNLAMRHLGCLSLLNKCRGQIEDEELRACIDAAISDAATLHPTMEFRQMKSGDWWIEPKS